MSRRISYTTEMLMNQSFMQFPKWLMLDPEFSKLSNDAKVLYTILKDRYSLSLKNKWIDKGGRPYLICKRTTMEQMLHKSNKTALKIFQELVDANLVEEKQNGLNKPNYIYLLMPEFSYEEPEFEEDSYIPEDSEKSVDNTDEIRTCKYYMSEDVKSARQDVENLHTNKNNSNKTNIINNFINDDNILSNNQNVVVNDGTKELIIILERTNLSSNLTLSELSKARILETPEANNTYLEKSLRIWHNFFDTDICSLYKYGSIYSYYFEINNLMGEDNEDNFTIKAKILLDNVLSSFVKTSDKYQILNFDSKTILELYILAQELFKPEKSEVEDKNAYLSQIVRSKFKL